MREVLFEGTIKGTPLIKFQKADIIDKIVNGSFYMNSMKVYRDRYYQEYDEEIGDPAEGMVYVDEGSFIVYKENIEVHPLQSSTIPTVSSDDYIFCMFGISRNNCFPFRFSDEQKKKWLEIYDTALVITDFNELVNRVYDAAISEGVEIQRGFVNYYDEKSGDISPIMGALANGLNSVAFYKRKRYAYQQEYRFTAPKCEKDYLELNIGNISGISKVFPLEMFFNSEIMRCHD